MVCTLFLYNLWVFTSVEFHAGNYPAQWLECMHGDCYGEVWIEVDHNLRHKIFLDSDNMKFWMKIFYKLKVHYYDVDNGYSMFSFSFCCYNHTWLGYLALLYPYYVLWLVVLNLHPDYLCRASVKISFAELCMGASSLIYRREWIFIIIIFGRTFKHIKQDTWFLLVVCGFHNFRHVLIKWPGNT